MKKILRLTESKLIELIEGIVAEQQSGNMIPKPTTNKFLPPPMSNEPELTKPEPGPETYEEAKELNAFNQKLLDLKKRGQISPEGFMNQYNRANPSRPIKNPNDSIIPYITTDKFIPPAMSKEPELTKPEPLQESINGIIKRFKKTISEQTQNFPGDDDARMVSFIDNELLDFGFKKEKVPSSGVRSMCKTYYTTGGFDNNAFLMLRCCGPNDSKTSTPGKCGHVVVGTKKNGVPQMVKSFNVNGFAMDSDDGSGKPMFALDLNKLKLATQYASKLKNTLQKPTIMQGGLRQVR
jgi:hypothetical protein